MRYLLTLLPLIVLATIFLGPNPASADDGSVSLVPGTIDVDPNETIDVDVVIDPPTGAEVAVWIIEFDYDPNIVQFVSCTVPTFSPPVVGAALCDVKSPPNEDTGVSLGGYIENVGGAAHGFASAMTVGTFTFEGVGAGEAFNLAISGVAILAPSAQSLAHGPLGGSVVSLHAPPPSPTPTPPPTPLPVGGSVELLSSPSSGSLASLTWLAALPLLLLAAAFAWRRVVRR